MAGWSGRRVTRGVYPASAGVNLEKSKLSIGVELSTPIDI
jgi:hypothetical protein